MFITIPPLSLSMIVITSPWLHFLLQPLSSNHHYNHHLTVLSSSQRQSLPSPSHCTIITTMIKTILYNNTCSLCIFIGRELCVIEVHTHGWRQLMAWSNSANLFRGSTHDFCQLYYNIKQIDFIFCDSVL